MATASPFDANLASSGSEQADRLYYLDWLRVLCGMKIERHPAKVEGSTVHI